MTAIFNNRTGQVLVLGDDGEWAAPTMAHNPQTGEQLYHHRGRWKRVPSQTSPGQPSPAPGRVPGPRSAGMDKPEYATPSNGTADISRLARLLAGMTGSNNGTVTGGIASVLAQGTQHSCAY